ncbi:DoxX family protein [Pedobacter changchengzhani]|uniref:DoxX family protein n=1 Tax=Pedobacter changchengzhani TaxID=2529274 RepID=A0A4R5MP09_9SPHI|nr:DoxX family protein [Pedobacter changchengzhani]TDG37542.1 DoxX family protein [Pedobacter changchengzhani]
MALLERLNKYRNTGLLILRVGIGAMMIVHGLPKIAGGVKTWTAIGGDMKVLGIDFLPAFWGFMAAATETFGGSLLVIGFLFRPVNLMLLFTMVIATLHHLKNGDGLLVATHPIELGILFFSLVLIGPGKYSVDGK